MGGRRKITQEEFENLVEKAHPNLKVVEPYVRLIDLITVEDHLGIRYRVRGQDLTKGKTPTIQSAIDKEKAFEIKGRLKVGDKYDYSKVVYKNARTHVTLICPEHGDFPIVPDCHTCRGHGCPVCARRQGDLTKKSNPSVFWKIETWKSAADKSKKFSGFKFYIIYCSDNTESFYKVGRTFHELKSRFEDKNKMPYKWEAIITIEGTAEEVCKMEDDFKSNLKDYIYIPKKEFCGLGECFKDNEYLKHYINETTN